MADITKCLNNTCPKRWMCRRYTEPDALYQSYGEFKPNEKGLCYDFWEQLPQRHGETADSEG